VFLFDKQFDGIFIEVLRFWHSAQYGAAILFGRFTGSLDTARVNRAGLTAYDNLDQLNVETPLHIGIVYIIYFLMWIGDGFTETRFIQRFNRSGFLIAQFTGSNFFSLFPVVVAEEKGSAFGDIKSNGGVKGRLQIFKSLAG